MAGRFRKIVAGLSVDEVERVCVGEMQSYLLYPSAEAAASVSLPRISARGISGYTRFTRSYVFTSLCNYLFSVLNALPRPCPSLPHLVLQKDLFQSISPPILPFPSHAPDRMHVSFPSHRCTIVSSFHSCLYVYPTLHISLRREKETLPIHLWSRMRNRM